jgi:hypothetical protein
MNENQAFNIVTNWRGKHSSLFQIVVEVVLGEQRGEGVRMGTRCLWDADTDNYASGQIFTTFTTYKWGQ